MLFSTPTQFAACALLFVAGWFLGLASHPGGRKWKDRYLAERDAHAANRRTWEAEHTTLTTQTDERVAAAKAGLDDREAAHRERIAELERENERLRTAAPTTAQTEAAHRERIAELERENERLRTAAPVTAQTIVPRAQRAARPADPNRGQRGWFDFR